MRYYNYELTETDLQQIDDDAKRFAVERLKYIKSFFRFYDKADNISKNDYLEMIALDELWGFEYKVFNFESIYRVYPEERFMPLPKRFADELRDYLESCFITHFRELLKSEYPAGSGE